MNGRGTKPLRSQRPCAVYLGEMGQAVYLGFILGERVILGNTWMTNFIVLCRIELLVPPFPAPAATGKNHWYPSAKRHLSNGQIESIPLLEHLNGDGKWKTCGKMWKMGMESTSLVILMSASFDIIPLGSSWIYALLGESEADHS